MNGSSGNRPSGSRASGGCPFASRRAFIAGAGGLVGSMGIGASVAATAQAKIDAGTSPAGQGHARSQTEPFWGGHQAGILTALQNTTYFAAFDVVTDTAGDVQAMLRAWTDAAARMAAGQPADTPPPNQTSSAVDSGEALGLPPSRLTLTFGFGPALFAKDGKDRFGLAAQRPEALVDLPRFSGEQLIAAKSDGDLSVQACADDPQVAFHAIRQLARLAAGTAVIRWGQAGFSSDFAAGSTPRNLMGFKDGTQNPIARRPVGLTQGKTTANPGGANAVVWAGDEAPVWMRGGSYVVFRRIRMAIEHWDRTDVAFQEQVIGRHKVTGAPLGGGGEFDALDLDATDKDGNPVIADDAHVRMASGASNGGAQILRRGYSYNDGADFTAERWPPWRQGVELDAGLMFVAYQRDPRTGFIRINENLSKLDALNQFTTHTASGLFACPPGAQPGSFIGEGLFG